MLFWQSLQNGIILLFIFLHKETDYFLLLVMLFSFYFLHVREATLKSITTSLISDIYLMCKQLRFFSFVQGHDQIDVMLET